MFSVCHTLQLPRLCHSDGRREEESRMHHKLRSVAEIYKNIAI